MQEAIDDDADNLLNVASDAVCYVNVSNSSPQTDGASCDVLSPTATQSFISVLLAHPTTIVVGRLRVRACNSEGPVRLRLYINDDVENQHIVRNPTFFLNQLLRFLLLLNFIWNVYTVANKCQPSRNSIRTTTVPQ